MEHPLHAESEALRRSWERHDAAFLRDYLVAGVEDPRINVQSMLTRHFLLGLRFGDRFRALREQELKFAAAVNWLLSFGESLAEAECRTAVRFGLTSSVENVEGIPIPRFARELWLGLPATVDGVCVPRYLAALLDSERPLEATATNTFTGLWHSLLAGEPPPAEPLAVMELACGSANDYRAMTACGLDRQVNYTGFDLSAKNIANARGLFPQTRFETADALALPRVEGAFAASFAHDLFEHLSPDALPVAVREFCRVTRDAACVGFFSMAEMPEHSIRAMEEYHWNTLSVARMRGLFAAGGFQATVIHIGTFLKWLTGDAATHNPNAYTFVLQRMAPGWAVNRLSSLGQAASFDRATQFERVGQRHKL